AERRPVDAWSPAPPLMNGMRMAAAGLTVALAVVLVVDLGGSSRSVNDEADTIGMFSPPGIEAGADTTDRSTAADDLEDPAPDVAAGANDDGGFRELDGVAQSAGATAPDATPAPEAADEVTASNLTLSGGEVQEPAAESGSDVDEVLAPVAESGGDFDELLAAEIGLGIALGIVVVAGAGMTLASRSRGRRV
ncbi:MAG: hypothetical protein IH957_13295, partial [Chloroflexi bacterium]|nr:hypothetical protein [Chloroflexota bacterium]